MQRCWVLGPCCPAKYGATGAYCCTSPGPLGQVSGPSRPVRTQLEALDTQDATKPDGLVGQKDHNPLVLFRGKTPAGNLRCHHGCSASHFGGPLEMFLRKGELPGSASMLFASCDRRRQTKTPKSSKRREKRGLDWVGRKEPREPGLVRGVSRVRGPRRSAPPHRGRVTTPTPTPWSTQHTICPSCLLGIPGLGSDKAQAAFLWYFLLFFLQLSQSRSVGLLRGPCKNPPTKHTRQKEKIPSRAVQKWVR